MVYWISTIILPSWLLSFIPANWYRPRLATPLRITFSFKKRSLLFVIFFFYFRLVFANNTIVIHILSVKQSCYDSTILNLFTCDRTDRSLLIDRISTNFTYMNISSTFNMNSPVYSYPRVSSGKNLVDFCYENNFILKSSVHKCDKTFPLIKFYVEIWKRLVWKIILKNVFTYQCYLIILKCMFKLYFFAIMIDVFYFWLLNLPAATYNCL